MLVNFLKGFLIGTVIYISLIFFEIFLMVKMLDFLCKSFVGISLSEFCNRLINEKNVTDIENKEDVHRENNKFENYIIIDQTGAKWSVNSYDLVDAINKLPFDSRNIYAIEIVGYVDKDMGVIPYDKPKIFFKG